MKNSLTKAQYAGMVLLWALTLCCCVADAEAQTGLPPKKLVITMDSPSLPYDPENLRLKRSNTNEIVDTLKSVKGLSIVPIATSLEWKGEQEVKEKKPDLIIIHWSAFVALPRTNENLKTEDDKFISFLRYMADSKSRFLVYTRHRFPDQKAGYKLLVDYWVRKDVRLSGRIEIFEFVPGKPLRFREPSVRNALRIKVTQVLGLT
jgi:hypothetical protein